MASKAIGFLNFKFGADLGGFERAMKKAQKRLKKFGTNIKKTGQTLSTGLTLPILAFGAASIKAFDEQEKAIAQVEAGLKSTGNAVGFTSEKLQEMASDLQKTSLFGDEEILKGATAQLLTFTNITGEQFKKTQEVVLDLATRLDGDLKSASIMLGKALNDPIANLSALSRAGIQFTDEQKATVKSMVETNNLAGAQSLILAELEKQYGGSAAAAAAAGMGPITQLTNQLSDLSEQIGERLIPYVNKLTTWFVGLAEKFDNLSESQKDNIVKWGLIIAAIGPVLMIIGQISIGISALIPVVTALSAAWVYFNGVLLANPFVMIVAAVAAVISALIYFTTSTSKMAIKVRDMFRYMANGVIMALNSLIEGINSFGDYIGLTIPTIKLFTMEQEEIAITSNKATEELKKVNKILNVVRLQTENKLENAPLTPLPSITPLTNTKEIVKYSAALDPLIKNIKEFSDISTKLWSDDGIQEGPENLLNWTEKLTKAQSLANAGYMMFGDVLTSSLDSALNSQESFFTVFIENIKKAIKSLLIQLAVMSLINMMMGGGAAAFSMGAIKGNLGKIMGVEGFAEGGLVTGPTTALIGEGIGTNAGNPEVIAPLDKLKQYMGGGSQNINVTGKLIGNDIYLSNSKTGTNRERSV